MKIESGDCDHCVAVAGEERSVDVVGCVELLETWRLFVKHKCRSNLMAAREETLNGDRTFADEELVSLKPPATWDIGEITVVVQTWIISGRHRLWGDGAHFAIGMA